MIARTESVVGVEERAELTDEAIRVQLDLLATDRIFSTSKRSVAFLRYVVERTLEGSADLLKERTIGVEVFERVPSYDTGSDHIVRTAAGELRKRLAIYYGHEEHKSELRIVLLPGSYVPHFAQSEGESEKLAHSVPASPAKVSLPSIIKEPAQAVTISPAAVLGEHGGMQQRMKRRTLLYLCLIFLVAGATFLTVVDLRPPSMRTRFWAPVLRASAPVLIAVGDVPNGPPRMMPFAEAADQPPSPEPGESDPPAVPFSDAVTIARITSVLTESGKRVIIRREDSSSFSDLREGPAVLVGAFNNEWSLRLTRPLRFSLAMDAEKRLIYIRDRDHPDSRQWSWSIDRHVSSQDRVSSATLHDYALISRIENSTTGQVVVVIGGLYTYGTQAAGEFLSDPQLMSLAKSIPLNAQKTNLQIVLETDVTQQTPGPPRVIAVSSN